MTEAEHGVCEDWISSLPDDLLVQILLLVSTEDAVATTFLSKRWRFVWTMLPKLDYSEETETSDDDVESDSVWSFLDDSFRFHKAPLLEHMRVELGPQCPIDVNPAEWVAKALDSRVRWLTFILRWRGKPIRMPESLYLCKTLERLTLSNKILVDVPRQASLPSLTELDLVSVVYKDEDSQARLLSGCPVLTHLIVIRNKLEDDNVRKFTVKVPSLIRLLYTADKIFEEEDDTDRSLVIDTPDLVHLGIIDTSLYSCSIEYMPHLVRAVINTVEFYPNENFLRSLSSVKYLDLYLFDTIDLWCKAFINYSRLVECEINTLPCDDLCESLVDLLSNCSKLEVLLVNTQCEIDQSENQDPFMWNEPSSVPRCLSSHLEKFAWDGYLGTEDEKGFIRYVLKNAKCLKTTRILPNSRCSDEEKQKMVEELPSLHRFQGPMLKRCFKWL